MDEAASRLRMEVDSKPEELDNLDREILQKQIEAEALKKEDDKASKDRLEKLTKELADLSEKSEAMTAQWQAERDRLEGSRGLKEQLDQARMELDHAKREGNLAKAGELSYGVIPQLEKQLAEAEAEGDALMVEEAVRPEQIAEVVERWTGIPTSKMLEGERDKLLRMEEELGKRVIGQKAGRDGRGQCGAPFARRVAGRKPAFGLVPVPRADGCRQDRADQGGGRVSV